MLPLIPMYYYDRFEKQIMAYTAVGLCESLARLRWCSLFATSIVLQFLSVRGLVASGAYVHREFEIAIKSQCM
jgi:hypothetical protein